MRQIYISLYELCQSGRYLILRHTILGAYQKCSDLVCLVIDDVIVSIEFPVQRVDMKEDHLLRLAHRI